MPELAEVEYYRKQWNDGLGKKVLAVQLHSGKRIFRGTDTRALRRALTGALLLRSAVHGKQMLFEFSSDNRLGIHLGMSGTLRVAAEAYGPEKHDHLALRQEERVLIFRDPRQFGRVRFHHGKSRPPWWAAVPEIDSAGFTAKYLADFLRRHGRAPIKAVILRQEGFPGVGNWMADEILWRAKIAPATRAGAINSRQRTALRRATRFVARESLRLIGHDYSDPPANWLIHQRWKTKGICPRHKTPLRRAIIGGRTTAWCAKCQPTKTQAQT